MSRCEKHDCRYEIRQMERGKTMPVCPKCEKEQIDKFREMLCVTDHPEKHGFPWEIKTRLY